MRTRTLALLLLALITQLTFLDIPSKASMQPPQTPASPQDNQAKIKDILSDSTLWGHDFPALLASIKDWGESGETKIEVFADEAVGATPQADIAHALTQAAIFHRRMTVDKPSFRPQFEASMQISASDAMNTVVPSAHSSKDDQSVRVVLLNSSAATQTSYLAPGLTIQQVQQRRGQPESVTTRLIDSGDERRPLVLRLYQYAQGAIVFAESDVTPRQGAVERVILDTAKISSAIF